MQTSAFVLLMLSCVGLPLLACSRDPEPSASDTAAAAPPSAGSAGSDGLPALVKSAPNAFAAPSVRLSAETGQFALVPLRSAIDLALRSGGHAASFVYIGAHVVRVGHEASEVRWLTEQRGVVPNAFIVPIRRDERVRRGDVVLTNFASGSGLQRAIVVSEGETTSPRVRYLDLAFENPTGWAAEEDVLPPNSFHVLRTPGEVGTTLACRLGNRVERVLITLAIDQRRIGVGFAGALHDATLSACRALPIVPRVRPDDVVHVPWLGGFVSAKVVAIDDLAGRVRVRVDFGGEARETQIGFTNVATDIPSLQ